MKAVLQVLEHLFHTNMLCNGHTTTSGLQKCAFRRSVWSHVQINHPLLTGLGMFIQYKWAQVIGISDEPVNVNLSTKQTTDWVLLSDLHKQVDLCS